MTRKRSFFLLARPRSGTTVLRDVLSQCSNAFILGEIFSDDAATKPLPFVPWYVDALTADPALIFPNALNRYRLMTNYLEFLRSQAPSHRDASTLMVTVNYNSMHFLNTVWQNVYDAPFICKLIKDAEHGVVHLVRKNVLRTYVSERKARATNVWHRRAGEDRGPAPERLQLNVEDLVEQLENRALEISLIERYFRGYKNAKTLVYEELFDEAGQCNQGPVQEILDFMGLERLRAPKITYARTSNSDLSHDVENWEQVKQALAGTRFEPLAHPEMIVG